MDNQSQKLSIRDSESSSVHRKSDKTLPQIGRPSAGAKNITPEVKRTTVDPYSTSVQGIQGDAAKGSTTVTSSQHMDNTNAQIRKVQEAQARFNQKRGSNSNTNFAVPNNHLAST